MASDVAINGWPVGWFAPDYKISSEAYNEIVDSLEPIIKSSNKVDGVIRLITGGRLDFWTLDNERAGRSRMYKLAVVDEAAFTKPNVMGIWEKSIKPTLLDLSGSAIALSNTNGVDPENFFWRICNEAKYGFEQYHAPTFENPYLPADELAKLKDENHPLVYQQEYLAEFVDWSGVRFFDLTNCLENDEPVDWPDQCDAVFATIDTAAKTGLEHDGTACIYWALVKRGPRLRLYVLDWELFQISGDLLETWLPTVFQNLKSMAVTCRSRAGSLGAYIEDQNSGTILLQQAARRGWPAQAVQSDLTAAGKDGRAISVSGYVYRSMVRVTRKAYDKVVDFKTITQNHFLRQVFSFRVGVDNKKDDLLDCFTYGIAIAFGDGEGH